MCQQRVRLWFVVCLQGVRLGPHPTIALWFERLAHPANMWFLSEGYHREHVEAM